MEKVVLKFEIEKEIDIIYRALLARKDWIRKCKEKGSTHYWDLDEQYALCEIVLQKIEKARYGDHNG